VREGLATVTWPGRFQVLRKNPLFIVDGGHNPQCLEALENAIRTYLPGQKLVFLNGCMADKDYGDMFRWLLPYAREFVTVTPRNPRALPAEALSRYITENLGAKATACATVAEGVRTAIEKAGPDGVVCACGSLYMIGDIVEALSSC
jgi:dihydrofolate synthase/folylpolyglutamate synthase